MAFLVRVQPVQRVSEYKGTTKDGNEYCIASWKVKNVADSTIMLVSCFQKDDEILTANPELAMDAELSIVCRDWQKDGRSGSMNNVNLNNVIGPEKVQDTPGQVIQPIVNNSLNPFDGGDDGTGLPF